LTMVPRRDGRPYYLEPVVNLDNCTSCGICVGSCPTSTPFRRAKPITPGIELPDRTVCALREQVMAPFPDACDAPRVIVFACDHSRAAHLETAGPSFIDFALSRKFADGVMLAGCAENDCYHRLGNEWTRHRLARERDPYLRERVPLERLLVAWLPTDARRRRAGLLREFRDRLKGAADE